MPLLLAVNTLYAHSGRGGLIVFERDEKGELVEDKHEGEGKVKRKNKKRTQAGVMMPMGQQKKRKRKSGATKLAEEKKKAEAENKKRQASLAGEAKEKEAETPEEDDLDSKDWKETTKGYRWVALTGTFDHKQQRDNYVKALKIDFASAAPHYLRLDAERQTQNPDGSWSEWVEVDREPSEQILDDAVEEEDELVPAEAIIKNIADYLPFLRSSYYRGVYVAELVPAEKLHIEMPKTPGHGRQCRCAEACQRRAVDRRCRAVCPARACPAGRAAPAGWIQQKASSGMPGGYAAACQAACPAWVAAA